MDENKIPGEIPEAQREKEGLSDTYDSLRRVMVTVIACVLVFVFAFRIVGVVGSSMVPTLHERDFLITTRLFYTPKRGDVVVLCKKSFDRRAIGKRVIATEGQTVDIDFDAGVVYVDNVPLVEDYVNAPTLRPLDFEGPVTVPENSIFVLGDNRNESSDSRAAELGCVDNRNIIGRVLAVLYPFKDMQLFF